MQELSEKEQFLSNITNIKKNKFGEYIADENGIPTGFYQGKYGYDFLVEYEKEHPEEVSEYIEYKEPTEEEMLLSMTEKEKANYHREKRDSLINKEVWKLQRHEQEKILGINTTLSEQEYVLLLQYIQALRELPQQEDIPNTVTYPVLK